MEDSKKDILEDISQLKKEKNITITLLLWGVIGSVIVTYSLITHQPAFNYYIDSSVFKPQLLWLGFVGNICLLESIIFLGIARNILVFKSLPNQECLGNIYWNSFDINNIYIMVC